MANAADLIREYKVLLDDGTITQEEFDKKKDKFLGQNTTEPHERIESVINGKALLDEGMITEEDFGMIKANIFSDSPKAYKTALTDLRPLNGLLSEEVITEADYDGIKSRVLKGDNTYVLKFSDTLKMLKNTHDKGILSEESYTTLKEKYLSSRTDPDPMLERNINELTAIREFLDEGLISPVDYETFEKNVAAGKVIRRGADISPIRDFKELLNRGIITEEDFDRIRNDLLFGKKNNNNYTWPVFLEEIVDLRGKEVISDAELASLKSAYMEGSEIPDRQAFEKIRRYIDLSREGVLDPDEIDILKGRAFSGVESLTDERLVAVRDYKKLLDEGTISNDDFKQYKSNQLNLGGGSNYVIMDAEAIKKKEKKKRKTIIMIILAAILFVAAIGVISYIPKLQAHKAVEDFINGADAMLDKGQYDEVSDTAAEMRDETYDEKLSEEDEDRLTMVGRYAYWLGSFDYTNGADGEDPVDVFDNMDELADYGIMPYLCDAYSKYKVFGEITNADGGIAGKAVVRTLIEHPLRKTTDGENEGSNETDQEEAEPQYNEKASDCEGELTFGFTKADPNAGLTEGNLVPSARIRFKSKLLNGAQNIEWYSAVFPLDQAEEFVVTQENGDMTGIGTYKYGIITITFGDTDDQTIFVFDHPKKVKSYSSSSSSSGSSSKNKSSGGWTENPTGNGYINDEGYIIYDNNGVTEITDGRGNWAQDTDGDGNLDTFGSDSWY